MGWQLGGNRKSLHRVPLHDQPSIRWHRTLPTERAKVPRWHHRLACKLLAKVPLWQGLNREFTAKILSHLHVGLILVGLTLEQRLSSKDCKHQGRRAIRPLEDRESSSIFSPACTRSSEWEKRNVGCKKTEGECGAKYVGGDLTCENQKEWRKTVKLHRDAPKAELYHHT
ncbi:hypothetical protein F5146DRAFT_1005537 [Armillaria mellea]|nr:hypothetical protein F5146DRAFT_1005537 [Armillaria mellea]